MNRQLRLANCVRRSRLTKPEGPRKAYLNGVLKRLPSFLNGEPHETNCCDKVRAFCCSGQPSGCRPGQGLFPSEMGTTHAKSPKNDAVWADGNSARLRVCRLCDGLGRSRKDYPRPRVI